MTLEEIKQLEHLTVDEFEYNIVLTPDYDYYIEVEDVPENKIYWVSVEMLIQPEYSQMWVKYYVDPSTNDASIADVSL